MGTPGHRARVIGRYALYEKIASGGMATVHLGRLVGPVGFARTVAIKCLHPNFARHREFSQMFIDEARVAARIRHPNVVQTIDVVQLEGEIFLVMDYVQGESFARLLVAASKLKERVTPQIIVPIMVSVLHGLHAAHEATDEHGEPLGIVHRDVSPHNVMVGTDGVARVLDFGVAKAAGRPQETRAGQLKGKIPYMSPEQIKGNADRLSDLYACSVVLWEALTARRLFQGESDLAMIAQVTEGKIEPPSTFVPEVPAELEAIVMKGLSRNPADRFASAREMARVLEKSVPLATSTEVSEWVEHLAGKALAERAKLVKEIERDSLESSKPAPPSPAEFGDFELHDTIVQPKPDHPIEHDPDSPEPSSTTGQSLPTVPNPKARALGTATLAMPKPSSTKPPSVPPSKPPSTPPPRPSTPRPSPPSPAPAVQAAAAASGLAPPHAAPILSTVRMAAAPPRPSSPSLDSPQAPAPAPPSSGHPGHPRFASVAAAQTLPMPRASSPSSPRLTGEDDETEPTPKHRGPPSSGHAVAAPPPPDRRVAIAVGVAVLVTILFTLALVLVHTTSPRPSPSDGPRGPAPSTRAAE